MEKKEKKEKNFIQGISTISTIIIGITLVAYKFNNLLHYDYFINPNDYDFFTDKLGQFGDFIGGVLGTVLTGIATYLVYKTYISQKVELNIQKQLITQQQFETTFFNMLNMHRELKKGLELNNLDFFYRPTAFELEDNYHGVNVFEKISKDYNEIYNNLESLHYNQQDLSNRINKDKLQNLQFLYNLSEDEFNPRPIMLTDIWDEDNNQVETHKAKIVFTFELLYMNYQNILSHYCRNVYHILKFIRKTEEEDICTKNDKNIHYKQYANILQSQLNVNEHFILFYNFIWHNENDEKNNIYFPMNIVNHYQFLENIGVNNLILSNHKKQYTFSIKGDN